MSPSRATECREHFLAELRAGAWPDIAAALAGISDCRTLLQWSADDAEFQAAWDRATAEARRREQLVERAKCPTALFEWLRMAMMATCVAAERRI
jgi:hypothetical protein